MKDFRLALVQRSFLAHQNPPNPEATSTIARIEELYGTELLTALMPAKATKPMDIPSSGQVACDGPFRIAINVTASVKAQTRPEKRFVLSAGTRTT